MTDLQRIREEQNECAELLKTDQCRGARLWASDLLAEECIILADDGGVE